MGTQPNEPQCKFEETFSGETVVMETHFPVAREIEEERLLFKAKRQYGLVGLKYLAHADGFVMARIDCHSVPVVMRESEWRMLKLVRS